MMVFSLRFRLLSLILTLMVLQGGISPLVAETGVEMRERLAREAELRRQREQMQAQIDFLQEQLDSRMGLEQNLQELKSNLESFSEPEKLVSLLEKEQERVQEGQNRLGMGPFVGLLAALTSALGGFWVARTMQQTPQPEDQQQRITELELLNRMLNGLFIRLRDAIFPEEAVVFEGQNLRERYGVTGDPTPEQIVTGVINRLNDLLPNIQPENEQIRNLRMQLRQALAALVRMRGETHQTGELI